MLKSYLVWLNEWDTFRVKRVEVCVALYRPVDNMIWTTEHSNKTVWKESCKFLFFLGRSYYFYILNISAALEPTLPFLLFSTQAPVQ